MSRGAALAALAALGVGCHSAAPVVVTVAPAAAPSASAPAVAAAAPWPDARRATSADGSFALEYPAHTFVRPSAKGRSITLSSDVSEPSFMGGGHGELTYSIELTKLDHGPVEELATRMDQVSFHERFPDGTGASFRPEAGFIERAAPNGYVLTGGAEGTGDQLHVFTTKDGTTWRFDCNYCCGMMDKPKMTSSAQLALCDEVLAVFVRQR